MWRELAKSQQWFFMLQLMCNGLRSYFKYLLYTQYFAWNPMNLVNQYPSYNQIIKSTLVYSLETYFKLFLLYPKFTSLHLKFIESHHSNPVPMRKSRQLKVKTCFKEMTDTRIHSTCSSIPLRTHFGLTSIDFFGLTPTPPPIHTLVLDLAPNPPTRWSGTCSHKQQWIFTRLYGKMAPNGPHKITNTCTQWLSLFKEGNNNINRFLTEFNAWYLRNGPKGRALWHYHSWTAEIFLSSFSWCCRTLRLLHITVLHFSYKRRSGRSSCAGRTRGSTLQASARCSCWYPMTQYPQGTTHRCFHRPEGHQSHPRMKQIGC